MTGVFFENNFFLLHSNIFESNILANERKITTQNVLNSEHFFVPQYCNFLKRVWFIKEEEVSNQHLVLHY